MSDLKRIPALARIAALESLAHGDIAPVTTFDEIRVIVTDAHAEIEAVTASADQYQRLAADIRLAASERVDNAVAEAARVSIEDALASPLGFYVYMLWGEGDVTPLYVGQSTNVFARLGQHMSDWRKRDQVTRITLLRCRSKAYMDSTETRLIRSMRPPWNIRDNPSAGSA